MLQNNLKPFDQAGLFNGAQVTQSLDPCGSPLYHGWQFGERAEASAFSAVLDLPSVTAGDTVTVLGKVFTARAAPTTGAEFSVADPGATLANAINNSLSLAPDYQAYVSGGLGGERTVSMAFVWPALDDALQPNDVSCRVQASPGLDYIGGGSTLLWSVAFAELIDAINADPLLSAVLSTTAGPPGSTIYTVTITQLSSGEALYSSLSGTGQDGVTTYNAVASQTTAAVSSLRVFLTARRTGAAYNLIVPTDLSGTFAAAPGFDATIVTTLGTDADAAQAELDWRAYVELWTAPIDWGRPDNFAHGKLLASFELPYVGGDEGYRVDVGRYLLNEVSVPLPPRAYSAALEYVGGYVGYRLKAAEQYLNSDDAVVPQIRNLADYGVRWAAPHAVPMAIDPPNNVAVWADAGPGWHEWPEYRLTRPVEAALPVYVWLAVAGTTPTAVELGFSLTLIDGTTVASTRALGSISRSGLYRFDLNPSQPPFDTVLPWLLLSATVSVGGEVQRTVTLRNDLNRDGRRWTTLLWRNRFGAYDSFTFDASSERELATDRVEYKRERLPSVVNGYYAEADPDDRISEGAQNQLVAEARTVLKLNSGLLDVTHYDWLRSLVVAPEVWIADDAPNIMGDVASWRAVNIADAEWVRGTEANLFNLELSVNYSHPEPVLQ